jgi:hypothetical protein
MQALDKPIHRIPNSTTHNSSKKQEYDFEQKKCIRITNKRTGWAMHVCCCLQCLAHAFVLPSSLRVLRRQTSSALPGRADPGPPRHEPAASPLPVWRRGWPECSPPPALLPLSAASPTLLLPATGVRGPYLRRIWGREAAGRRGRERGGW